MIILLTQRELQAKYVSFFFKKRKSLPDFTKLEESPLLTPYDQHIQLKGYFYTIFLFF